VENPADHDRVVSRIVVPQQPPRGSGAPTELRLAQSAGEVLGVEPVEECVEVITLAYRRVEPLTPAGLPHLNRLPPHVRARHEAAIAALHFLRRPTPQQLREQDVR